MILWTNWMKRCTKRSPCQWVNWHLSSSRTLVISQRARWFWRLEVVGNTNEYECFLMICNDLFLVGVGWRDFSVMAFLLEFLHMETDWPSWSIHSWASSTSHFFRFLNISLLARACDLQPQKAWLVRALSQMGWSDGPNLRMLRLAVHIHHRQQLPSAPGRRSKIGDVTMGDIWWYDISGLESAFGLSWISDDHRWSKDILGWFLHFRETFSNSWRKCWAVTQEVEACRRGDGSFLWPICCLRDVGAARVAWGVVPVVRMHSSSRQCDLFHHSSCQRGRRVDRSKETLRIQTRLIVLYFRLPTLRCG